MTMALELLSQRTLIRLVRPTDLEAIHELLSLPETDRYNTQGIPKDIEETRANLESWIATHSLDRITNYTFAIELRSTQTVIGLFGLMLRREKYRGGEVWYKLHSDHWNRGLATEVLSRMLDFGFGDLNLHRIQAGCAVENIGSVKVLEKVGMIKEGRQRQVLPLKTGWSDTFEYAILDTDPRQSIF